MSITTFLPHLMKLPAYRDQIAHIEYIRATEAIYGEVEAPLHPRIQASLESNGLYPLYSHQAAAINSIRSGNNVVVVTPTASGKTLCYNVPVLDTMLSGRGSISLQKC